MYLAQNPMRDKNTTEPDWKWIRYIIETSSIEDHLQLFADLTSQWEERWNEYQNPLKALVISFL